MVSTDPLQIPRFYKTCKTRIPLKRPGSPLDPPWIPPRIPLISRPLPPSEKNRAPIYLLSVPAVLFQSCFVALKVATPKFTASAAPASLAFPRQRLLIRFFERTRQVRVAYVSPNQVCVEPGVCVTQANHVLSKLPTLVYHLLGKCHF